MGFLNDLSGADKPFFWRQYRELYFLPASLHLLNGGRMAGGKENSIMAKVNVEKVVSDAANIEQVWVANPAMTLGVDNDPNNPKVTLADYQAAKQDTNAAVTLVGSLDSQLTKAMDDRDDSAKNLSDLNTRALSAIRGIFGPNSAQYDQAGGVRTSERKKPVRTKTTTATK
jgi:hypothetical protein